MLSTIDFCRWLRCSGWPYLLLPLAIVQLFPGLQTVAAEKIHPGQSMEQRAIAQHQSPTKLETPTATETERLCPEPVLLRLHRHRVTSGDSLESIARQYNLLPTTLQGLNPHARTGKIASGSELLIPPFNGIQVKVSPGSNWRDLAEQFGVRADVLFEVNGCQQNPSVVFVPGVNWSPNRPTFAIASGITGYPLPQTASVVVNYGWRVQPETGQVSFHSGIDLFAAPGTPVLSAAGGTVAFSGQQDNYGILVVVNHAQGRQTRYAHLSSSTVTLGQQVKQGEQLGTTGMTGQPDSNQPHLHFEVRHNSSLGWVAEDPTPYFRTIEGRENQSNASSMKSDRSRRSQDRLPPSFLSSVTF